MPSHNLLPAPEEEKNMVFRAWAELRAIFYPANKMPRISCAATWTLLVYTRRRPGCLSTWMIQHLSPVRLSQWRPAAVCPSINTQRAGAEADGRLTHVTMLPEERRCSIRQNPSPSCIHLQRVSKEKAAGPRCRMVHPMSRTSINWGLSPCLSGTRCRSSRIKTIQRKFKQDAWVGRRGKRVILASVCETRG